MLISVKEIVPLLTICLGDAEHKPEITVEVCEHTYDLLLGENHIINDLVMQAIGDYVVDSVDAVGFCKYYIVVKSVPVKKEEKQ